MPSPHRTVRADFPHTAPSPQQVLDTFHVKEQVFDFESLRVSLSVKIEYKLFPSTPLLTSPI
jgi:hypothetical protein